MITQGWPVLTVLYGTTRTYEALSLQLAVTQKVSSKDRGSVSRAGLGNLYSVSKFFGLV